MHLLFSVISFWAHSHYLVAGIAQNYLDDNEKKIMDSLVNSKSLPHKDMVEIASWTDDLNYVYFWDLQYNWHFSSPPFILEKFTGDFVPYTYSVNDYLKQAYETLLDPTTTSKWAIAYTLRNFIHFVGDIHTPHHNIAMYNDTNFPAGDLGGNLYTLDCPYGDVCGNMHSIWDCAGFLYPMLDPPAVSMPYIKDFKQNVSKLLKLHPISQYSEDFITEFNPDKWKNESFDIAKDYGYLIPWNTFPYDSYVDVIRSFTQERICVAGYRLLKALKKFLSIRKFSPPKGEKVSAFQICGWIFDSLLVVFIIVLLLLKKKEAHILSYYEA